MTKALKTITFFGSHLVLLMALELPSMAADAPPIPEGSYKESCKHMKVEKQGTEFALMAECEGLDVAGEQITRVTDLKSVNGKFCPGQAIENCNGYLKCASDCVFIPPIPKGSYKESCRLIKVEKRGTEFVLKAECEGRRGGESKRGRWIGVMRDRGLRSVNRRFCPGQDIANCDGELKCANDCAR